MSIPSKHKQPLQLRPQLYSDDDAAGDALLFVQTSYDLAALGLCGYGYEVTKVGEEEDTFLKSRSIQSLHDELKRLGEIMRLVEYSVDSSSSSSDLCKVSKDCNSGENHDGKKSSGSNSNNSSNGSNNPFLHRYFRDAKMSLPLEWYSPEDKLEELKRGANTWYVKRSSDVYNEVYSSSAQAEVTSQKNKTLAQVKKDYVRDGIFINGNFFRNRIDKDYDKENDGNEKDEEIFYKRIQYEMESKCSDIRKDCNYPSADILSSKFTLFSSYCLWLASSTEIGADILLKCLQPLFVSSSKRMLTDGTKPTKLRLYSKYEVTEDRRYPNPRCIICCDIDTELAYEISPMSDPDDDPDVYSTQDDYMAMASLESIPPLRVRTQCLRTVQVYLDTMDNFYSISKILVKECT